MAAVVHRLGSCADIDALVTTLAQSGGRIRPVEWKGQRAWLKLSVPQPPAWRYQLLAGMARLIRQPAIQPVRPHGGVAGIRNEVSRITALAEAGVRVPELLAHADSWLLIADLGKTTLESLIRNSTAEVQLEHWQRGADYILQVHRSGQYLSQAFARNLVWSPDHGLGAIDFEDDPASAMSLSDAQIRDWLPYLFSTAFYFKDRLPLLCESLHAALELETASVREGIEVALRRTSWLRALRWLPQGMQRRDVLKTQSFGELAYTYGKRATKSS